MKFDNIRMVLVSTSHPGNIGSTARAMKNMGFSQLYLVAPELFPDKRAVEMAAGADDVLEHAVVTRTLAEALEGCQLILASSARPRDIALTGLTPAEGAALVTQAPDDTPVAIVFGRERTGLTNDELLHCHYHIQIPSNPEFSSLNLSQAVQVIAYELRMSLLQPTAFVGKTRDPLAPSDDVERFYTHLRDVLIEIDFLKPTNPKRLIQRLRRLFNRAKLEVTEVNILRGILTQIQETLNKRQT